MRSTNASMVLTRLPVLKYCENSRCGKVAVGNRFTSGCMDVFKEDYFKDIETGKTPKCEGCWFPSLKDGYKYSGKMFYYDRTMIPFSISFADIDAGKTPKCEGCWFPVLEHGYKYADQTFYYDTVKDNNTLFHIFRRNGNNGLVNTTFQQ
ncbi:hypothetical protein Fcan01_21874 [Folsomia candida]|uniref:Uncharacterized protein n=1 Tax=Folsomia candida TaxID=158441 RepID=A0A226DFR9_FOLCA|nr:hypothetical protein Fcan01_21874 [Folsomia candida]